jgi:hypothetical protein
MSEAGELGRDGNWLFGGEGAASLRGSPPKSGRSSFHEGGARMGSGVHGRSEGGVRYSQIERVGLGCCMAHAANSQAWKSDSLRVSSSGVIRGYKVGDRGSGSGFSDAVYSSLG